MKCLVNPSVRPRYRRLRMTAAAFHAALPGYRPTPVRDFPALAAALGLAAVGLKDESDRPGLPAFKVLGALWATERAMRDDPEVHTLVTASAGNHGRAVARVAALRDLGCRVFVPARAAPARREAIAGEGAEVVAVDGTYEDAVARGGDRRGGRRCRCLIAPLAAGEPTVVPTPGTTMAGLDCAEVSPVAWPSPREVIGLRPTSRVLLLATEGPTDPPAYRRAIS